MALLAVGLLIAGVLASFPCCVRDWGRAQGVRGEPQARWTAASALFLTLAIAALLRFLVPGHHAMYVDEPWYAEAACNLVRFGRLETCQQTWSGVQCEAYGKGIGWPVLLAPATLIFGCGNSVDIQLARILGCVTVGLVALAVRFAGGGRAASILAAAILAIHPTHVAWSATAETNVPAAAALVAGICGALLYLRQARLSGATLAVSAFGLAAAIRPELAVPGITAAAVIGVVATADTGQRLAVLAAIMVASIAGAATGFRLWSMNESISGGAFLSLGNIAPNFLGIDRSGWVVHGAIILLSLAGAARLARRQARGPGWLLASTGITAALVALAYDRFHARMLLSSTVCLLPLGAFALDLLPRFAVARRAIGVKALAGGVLLAVLLFLWRDALESASLAPETQLLETRIAARVGQLPLAAALIVTAQPPVVAATGATHVMSTALALGDEAQLMKRIRGGEAIYFLCDMYCESGFAGANGASSCGRVFEHFGVTAVAEEKLNRRTYALYRLHDKAAGGSEPPRCPGISPG